MSLAYIDETGLHLPDYPTVLEHLKTQMYGIFGNDLYLEPDSQEGEMLAIFAVAIHDAYCLAGSVYHAYSPATAQGTGLSRMVVINGLRRHGRSHSTVSLRVVGEAGTLIKSGVVEDTAGRRWLLPAELVIPLAGEIAVTATAQDAGDLRAAPNEITKIATPCRGWQSVSNPDAAFAGAPVEQDSTLRARQRVSTALPSRTVFEGTVGAVASEPHVTRWRGYENDSDKHDEHGIPPHHICVVVEGGDNQAIAEAIAIKKTPGTGTLGDTTLITRDRYGVPKPISFYRPVRVRVAVRIVIRALAGYVSTTGERLRTNVCTHINTIEIGEDVLLSRVYCPVNESDMQGQRTFDVLSISLGSNGGTMAAVNIPIAFNAVAFAELDDIVLEVQD